MNETKGIIHPGANAYGFSKEKFDGYLWKKGQFMWISLITSKCPGCGNVRKLFDAIESFGLRIIVPVPSSRMMQICRCRGMELVTMRSDGEYIQAMVKIEADITLSSKGKVEVSQRGPHAAPETKEANVCGIFPVPIPEKQMAFMVGIFYGQKTEP